MNKAKNNNRDGDDARPCSDLRTLERMLRDLPAPEVPEALEAKLLASIPASPPRKRAAGRLTRRLAWAGIGTAAAGLLVAALVLSGGRPPARDASIQARQEPPKIRIRDFVEREAIAARLGALAAILANQPGGQSEAAEVRRYIARAYTGTSACARIAACGSHIEGENR